MAAILRSIRRRLTVTNEIRELFNAHDQSVLLSPDIENEDDSGEKRHLLSFTTILGSPSG
jgi:hypothetical protein